MTRKIRIGDPVRYKCSVSGNSGSGPVIGIADYECTLPKENAQLQVGAPNSRGYVWLLRADCELLPREYKPGNRVWVEVEVMDVDQKNGSRVLLPRGSSGYGAWCDLDADLPEPEPTALERAREKLAQLSDDEKEALAERLERSLTSGRFSTRSLLEVIFDAD